jgi:5-carboxymethyl-2-hydroxymuconate isomerase
MKLATYRFRGRDSYGAVKGASSGDASSGDASSGDASSGGASSGDTGEGGDGAIVDLKSRLPQFPTLLALLRGTGLALARAAAKDARVDVALADVELLPPLHAPEKILCVGINYANRNADYDLAELPQYPSLFCKAPNSLVGSGQPILIPIESAQLDYEAEIAIVIGKEGRRVPRDVALDYIAGVTLCNEGTIRDWTRHGKFNVTQGKNWDATGSIGPWIVTADEIDLARPLHLTARLNGEVVQDDTTAHMIFPFAELIRYVSTFMTLKPGDIIVTGTPVKLCKSDPPVWLKAGDVLDISVPEIGTLHNAVVAET